MQRPNLQDVQVHPVQAGERFIEGADLVFLDADHSSVPLWRACRMSGAVAATAGMLCDVCFVDWLTAGWHVWILKHRVRPLGM